MIIPVPTALWKTLFAVMSIEVLFLAFKMPAQDIALSTLGLFMIFVLPNWVTGRFR